MAACRIVHQKAVNIVLFDDLAGLDIHAQVVNDQFGTFRRDFQGDAL